jgi:hypothetical protein
MWTYDGDSWIDEGASPDQINGQTNGQTNGETNGEVKRPNTTSRFEELYPELQVVEMTPVTPRTNRVPPHPVP